MSAAGGSGGGGAGGSAISSRMSAAEYQRTIAEPARAAAPMDDVLFKRQYGMKKTPKVLTPTEDELTKQIAKYLDILTRRGDVKKFTHIPNETYTPHHAVKNRNKAMGVRSGVPDMLIIFEKGILFLELKREGRSVVSASQDAWITAINNTEKARAVIAKGYSEAFAAINQAIDDFK